MANDPNWRLPEVPSFTLDSPDFEPGGPLPGWAREDGGGQSPALRWHGAPAETRSYALTVYDPDAPTGSGFWHWAVYGLPADLAELPRDASATVPGITLPNEYRQESFTGAAPPAGHGEHRYFFTLSALDTDALEVPARATPAVLGFLMREHVIGRAQLVGTAETPA